MQTKSIIPLGTEECPLDPSGPELLERLRALEAELKRRDDAELALRATLDETTRSASRLLDALRAEREARERAEEETHAKDELIAVLAHDLKNPLGNVLTGARLLAMRKELPIDARARLERVVSSGTRMQRMIDQMADVTEERRGGALVDADEEADVASLVESVVVELRAAHPSRIVDLHADGTASPVLDRARFLQAIRTLVGNAVVHGAPDRAVRVDVLRGTSDIRIEVRNDGPPIDEAERDTLFDPRRRRRTPSSDALGLGLYLCERIVAAHGGTLTMESAAGRGTLFRVTLPCPA